MSASLRLYLTVNQYTHRRWPLPVRHFYLPPPLPLPLSIRPPGKNKQSASANLQLKNVLKEHEIHGADVVRWCQVMSLVVRPFLKKYNGGVVADEFRPLGPNGEALSKSMLNTILRDVGRAYFGVDNLQMYAMRTSQTAMAYRDVRAVGLDDSHDSLQELFREQRTSEEVGVVSWS